MDSKYGKIMERLYGKQVVHPSDGNGNLATNPIASNFSRGLLEIPDIRNLQMISHENCHVNRRFSSHV